MPFLQLAYTDRSGTPHPNAVVEVVALHLELSRAAIAGDVQCSIYHDQAALDGGLPPFEERPASPLSPAEIAALEVQFTLAIYQTLQQRTEFSAASVVDG
jgi:hypothetical protein